MALHPKSDICKNCDNFYRKNSRTKGGGEELLGSENMKFNMTSTH